MEKLDWLLEQDEEILTADGFDHALIGTCERAGGQPTIAMYDTDKCLAILRERDGMTEEEAEEYFYFNVVGAWVGDYTPCFVTLYKEN
jgi:hypothetical protein